MLAHKYRNKYRKWAVWGKSVALLAAMNAGCSVSRPDCVTSVSPPAGELLWPIEAFRQSESAPSLQGPLTLDRALETALQHHPDLAVAAAQLGVAQGNVVQAGLYPNPTVGYIGEQIGSLGGAGGQQGPYISQEIVTGGKLKVAQAAAWESLTATQWQAVSKRFELEAKVRTAYFEALTAQREVAENEGIVKIATENYEASQKLARAGIGSQPDVLRARVELEANQNKLIAAKRRLEAAWPLLANAMGLPGHASVPLQGELETAKPDYQLQSILETVLARHSELMQMQASIAEAEKLVTRSRLENTPNVDVKVQPLYDYTESVGQVSFEVGMKLPIWNKNQGNIQAAEFEVVRRTNELQSLKLKLNDRVIQTFQHYSTARDQALKFEKDLIPQSQEALRLIKKAFETGDAKYDYTGLLDAQRTLAQARLNYIQTLGEFWKAVAEIQGLLQSVK